MLVRRKMEGKKSASVIQVKICDHVFMVQKMDVPASAFSFSMSASSSSSSALKSYALKPPSYEVGTTSCTPAEISGSQQISHVK